MRPEKSGVYYVYEYTAREGGKVDVDGFKIVRVSPRGEPERWACFPRLPDGRWSPVSTSGATAKEAHERCERALDQVLDFTARVLEAAGKEGR